MVTFALTGITGLLGQNLLYEILKNNLHDLDYIKIICFGRGTKELSLLSRIEENIKSNGWKYILSEYNSSLVEKICSVVIPIGCDLSSDNLNIDLNDYKLLTKYRIDYFFHLAALTDLRRLPNVINRLVEINVNGTKRILNLIDTFSYKIKEFIYVSSAYTCGKAYGEIHPDYINLDQNFRNPYEKTKLLAEILCYNYCNSNDIRHRKFRPSTIGGRIFEKPTGFVNKYDVYLGWACYFLNLKVHMIKSNDWDEIYETPLDIPIRIHANPKIGLNIVPSDFCAKVMYHAVLYNNRNIDYHIVSRHDLLIDILIPQIFKLLNINGWSYINNSVEDQNKFEKLYYRYVGSVYTPYINYSIPMDFNYTSMQEVCNDSCIAIHDINKIEDILLMLQYARENNFGLNLNHVRK